MTANRLSDRSILITGAGGQLGSDLDQRLRDSNDVVAAARAVLDITDDRAVKEAFEAARPDLVFNCAAFHNVDVCEREVDRSFEVNARAVKQLAVRCAEAGAKLVHLSTNYVFDGDRDRDAFYCEHDLPCPRSIYAISKLAGEYAARAYCPNAMVVRSSGLYGLHGSASKGGNFVQRMLGRAREQDGLRMVADQLLTPTYTADLADALIEGAASDTTGLFHLTNSGSCSWHEFTLEIMALADLATPVEAVETVTPAGGAQRPLNGLLSCERAGAAGLGPMRHWRDALESYMTTAGLRVVAASP